MNDPYRTPQSDVKVIRPVSKAKWKVFFWVVLFLEILSIVFMIIDPEESALEIVAELIIYPIIIIGIFGFHIRFFPAGASFAFGWPAGRGFNRIGSMPCLKIMSLMTALNLLFSSNA